MKIKKKIIILILTIIMISIALTSKAGVEIKEGTTAYTNVNISESFEICYNLRDGTSTLGTSSLDPHLATSLDWGAVAYLAQSRYGANASSISTNTTGNKSGVMNMNGYTQTATMFEDRNLTSTESTSYRYLLDEATQSEDMKKYVDIISNTVNETTTIGRAIAETVNWYGANYFFDNGVNSNRPLIIRDSLFGVNRVNFDSYYCAGQAHSSITFRPVIWN